MGAGARRAELSGIRSWFVPAAVGLISTAVYTWFSAAQWARFEVPSFDNALYTQLLQAYAEFREPIVPIAGIGFNLLGDHFHPLLAIFAPVFWVAPHGFALLVVQNAGFGVAAALITWCARRQVGPLNGIVLGGAFALSWGLQSAVAAQFHEVALSVPLIAGSLVAIVERRWVTAAVCAALLVFVKEDLGITVVVISIVIAWQSGRRAWLLLAVWGAGWFALTTTVILPALNPSGSWGHGQELGIANVVGDPAALFAPAKFLTVGLLLASGALLLLRSPIALVLLPTLAWRFLSENPAHWGTSWHYSAVLMPIVFVALIDAIQRSRQSKHRSLRLAARWAPVAAGAVAIALLPFFPLRTLVLPAGYAAPLAAEARAALSVIPAGASVDSDKLLINYLVDDHPVAWLWRTGNPPPDCLAAGVATLGENGIDGFAALSEDRYPGERYRLVHEGEQYAIACRF